MTLSRLIRRGHGAWQRRSARWLARRRFILTAGRPIISFSFDDFPASAFQQGGAILEHYGLAGTYYTSLGLSGHTTVCGRMFTSEMLQTVVERGHELGCHTFGHCPAWETSPTLFEDAIHRNADALCEIVPSATFRTLSYPISYPRPDTKLRSSRYFTCCRGGGQTFNHGTLDLNYLSAFFLEQCGESIEVVRRLMNENRQAGGWLILATHDVDDHPTRFGCTQAFFEQVVNAAIDSDAEILPVGRALQRLKSRHASTS